MSDRINLTIRNACDKISFAFKNVHLAQLDRAFGYGPKGRGFESSNARIKKSAGFLPIFLYVLKDLIWGSILKEKTKE